MRWLNVNPFNSIIAKYHEFESRYCHVRGGIVSGCKKDEDATMPFCPHVPLLIYVLWGIT